VYAPAVRILCISDVHGHAEALAAVLATAERRGYSTILVAGDLCFPGPQPLETWRRLTQAGAICVQGAGDLAMTTLNLEEMRPQGEHEQARLEQLRKTRDELGDLILQQLAHLPSVHRMALPDGRELIVVHGSPTDPLEPFTHDMTDQEVSVRMGDDPADIVVCGGSHAPFERVLGEDGGVRIINVGSVGEALNGLGPGSASTHADATFIEVTEEFTLVEQFMVPLGRAA